GDPTGSYNRYSFASSGNNFNDYPKLGVWPDAYYITYNYFNAAGTAFVGGEVCAYDRAKMLAGQGATQQCFPMTSTYGGALPADVDGSNQPAAGTPNFIVAIGPSSTATDHVLPHWKFHVDWHAPASR